MKSTFYFVLIFSLFTAKWCSGQPGDSDGFRELPSQQERNFRSLYSSSGALGNIPDTYSSASSTTEMPQLTSSDICKHKIIRMIQHNYIDSMRKPDNEIYGYINLQNNRITKYTVLYAYYTVGILKKTPLAAVNHHVPL